MDQNKFETLMKEYREGVTSTPEAIQRVVKPQPLRRRWATRLAIAGAVGSVGLAATLMLLPGRASAAEEAVHQLTVALQGVRTMHMEASMGTTGKKWLDLWEVDGAWRTQSRIGTPMETTWILRKDGHELTYRTVIGQTCIAPNTNNHLFDRELPNPTNPIDFALTYGIGDVHVGTNRAQIETTSDPRYRMIVLTQKDGNRMELLVDKETNLPVKSTLWQYHGTEELSSVEFRYEFNKTPDRRLFEPPTTPVIDALQEEKKFKATWKTPLALVPDGNLTAAIHDVQATRDGAVYVAYSVQGQTNGAEEYFAPQSISDDHGHVFLKLHDQELYTMAQGEGNFTVGGAPVRVATFEPIEPLAPDARSGRLQLGFGYRPRLTPGKVVGQLAGYAPDEFNRAVAAKTVEVSVRNTSLMWPDYASTIGSSLTFSALLTEPAEARAHYFASQHQWRKAYRWLMDRYEVHQQTSYTGSRRAKQMSIDFLKRGAEYLIADGRIAEAKDLTKKAEELSTTLPASKPRP